MYGEVEMSLLLRVRSPFCSDEIVRSAFVAERRGWKKKSRERERPEAPILQRGCEQTEFRVGRCFFVRLLGSACSLRISRSLSFCFRELRLTCMPVLGAQVTIWTKFYFFAHFRIETRCFTKVLITASIGSGRLGSVEACATIMTSVP